MMTKTENVTVTRQPVSQPAMALDPTSISKSASALATTHITSCSKVAQYILLISIIDFIKL